MHSPQSSVMMARIILGVLYLSGWCVFSTLPLRQYHYVAEPMNWTEAQTYCRKTYTDLATAENIDEMNQLMNTVPSGVVSVWIGLYSEIHWKWSDGYNGTDAEYRYWLHSEPDFLLDNEFCVVTGKPGDPWWDDDCLRKYPFICNNGTQLDPEFVFVGERLNWSSAQSYCRKNFKDLATLRSDSESQEIQSMLSNGWAWIGLFRDPHIYWSDGSGFSFRYWYRGAKTIRSMKVVCGVAALPTSGRWKLFPCENRFPFVCYSSPPAPVTRLEVKLRMKLDDSSVNMNDPVVKAEILKKLQDRLTEKGVNGVTLKWREQPDGNVFHKEEKRSQEKERKKF